MWTAKTDVWARYETIGLNKTSRIEKALFNENAIISVIHLNRFQSKDYPDQTSHQFFSLLLNNISDSFGVATSRGTLVSQVVPLRPWYLFCRGKRGVHFYS